MQKTPILIVGAGPSGLVLALWLHKKSIPFRIIDKGAKPGETSRALAIQARTLEFYRQLGIADDIVSAGITAKEIKIRRGGRIVATARLGAMGIDASPFPYLLFLSQDIHEKILSDKLTSMGVKIERQTELVEFSQTEAEISATLRSPKGVEKFTADYICGCDGAHSQVRHSLGIEFPGGTYAPIFFVTDVGASGDISHGGLQVSVSKKDFCIVMPIQKLDSVRLTGIVPPEKEGKEQIEFSDVAESVRLNTGLDVKTVNWFSSYHVHHRVANQFRKGRGFLSGDAGHIHSPAGGQGMNTGIGDAINLAWKLADVVQGKASTRILDTYETERIAFARVLVATTDTAFRFIASRTWIGSISRAFVLPTVLGFLTRFDFVPRFFFKTISQIRIQYRHSSLSVGVAGGIRGGDRLPWVKTTESDNYKPLSSLDWQIHVYGTTELSFKSAAEKLKLPVHEFSWLEGMRAKGFKRNGFYLLRPDGYVGLACGQQDSQILENYLRKM